MTVALAIKVHDGLVLATDSATTIGWTNTETGIQVANSVYNNANKMVNLHRDLPIGLMTWGLGNVGQQSISTLAKEIRRRLQGENPRFPEWSLDSDSYTIKEVADKVRIFLHDEMLSEQVKTSGPLVDLGVFIGGFSSDSISVESYSLTTNGMICAGPDATLTEEFGAVWYAQGEAISRLVLGFSQGTEQALLTLGVSATDAPAYVDALKKIVHRPLIAAPMPIQDVIDLAIFLVDASIKFTRFSPGYDTVGGPIEVAAITRHEGFKWINRKHYYSAELNPNRSKSYGE